MASRTEERKARGGAGRGQGRKPLKVGEKTVSISFRGTEAQRDRFKALGSGEWVRDLIDAAKWPKCVAIHVRTGTRYYSVTEAYRQAEEYECAMMALDKAGAPRADEKGEVFSLWGRILRFAETPSNMEITGRPAAQPLDCPR